MGNRTYSGHLYGCLSHYPSISSDGGVGIHILVHCDRERQQHRIYITTIRSTTEFHFPSEDSRSYHVAHLEPVSPESRSRILCHASITMLAPSIFSIVHDERTPPFSTRGSSISVLKCFWSEAQVVSSHEGPSHYP